MTRETVLVYGISLSAVKDKRKIEGMEIGEYKRKEGREVDWRKGEEIREYKRKEGQK